MQTRRGKAVSRVITGYDETCDDLTDDQCVFGLSFRPYCRRLMLPDPKPICATGRHPTPTYSDTLKLEVDDGWTKTGRLKWVKRCGSRGVVSLSYTDAEYS